MLDQPGSNARNALAALLDDHREHLTSRWASWQPVPGRTANVWVVLHGDGYATGVGLTRAEAWQSAVESELLSMRGDDDSARYSASLATVEAELFARTEGHHATWAHLVPGGVEAFCKTIDVKPGDRIYALIEAVSRAAGGNP